VEPRANLEALPQPGTEPQLLQRRARRLAVTKVSKKSSVSMFWVENGEHRSKTVLRKCWWISNQIHVMSQKTASSHTTVRVLDLKLSPCFNKAVSGSTDEGQSAGRSICSDCILLEVKLLRNFSGGRGGYSSKIHF
jgi:hypothetical protein